MDNKEILCNLTQSLVKALDLVLQAHDFAPDKIVLTFKNCEREGKGLILNVKTQNEADLTEVTLNMATQKLDNIYGVLRPIAI